MEMESKVQAKEIVKHFTDNPLEIQDKQVEFSISSKSALQVICLSCLCFLSVVYQVLFKKLCIMPFATFFFPCFVPCVWFHHRVLEL